MNRIAAHLIDIRPLLDRYDGNQSHLARLLGVHHSRINRALHRGVTPYTADRWAVRLGYHPTEIWTDWYQETAA